MFGQQTQQPQQNGTTGGMFGNLGQSQPASNSLFGSQTQQPAQQQQPQQQQFGGGLFSGLGQSSMSQSQQPQPSLTASIDQNPYGRNELFAYSGQKLDYGSTSKKPALPSLTSSSFRITPSSKSQISKLRGFASPLNVSQSPARTSSPMNGLASPGRLFFNSPSTPDRYKGLTDTALTLNAFVPRPSIKKLTVTPKTSSNLSSEDRLESVLGKSALRSSVASPTPERSVAPSPTTSTLNPPTGSSRDVNSPLRRNAPLDSSLRVSGSERQPRKGEYWCKPKAEKLGQMGPNDLRELHNFTAGRRGYGEVTFLDPVDLTGLEIQSMLGSVIVFSEMELAVYPDDFRDKPARGHGLNVPAQITLEGCFSKDKATKQPITDQSDPRHTRFLKRVKTIPDTDFVSYTDDGMWTFKVEHFSRYGIGESDEESEASPERGEKEKQAYSPSESETSDDDILPPTKGLREDDDGEKEEHDSGIDEDDEMYEDESELDAESPDSEGLDGRSSPIEPTWDQPLKAKIGAEGMRKLREMQSSFFGETKTAERRVEKRTGSLFREAGEDIVKLDEGAVKVRVA